MPQLMFLTETRYRRLPVHDIVVLQLLHSQAGLSANGTEVRFNLRQSSQICSTAIWDSAVLSVNITMLQTSVILQRSQWFQNRSGQSRMVHSLGVVAVHEFTWRLLLRFLSRG